MENTSSSSVSRTVGVLGIACSDGRRLKPKNDGVDEPDEAVRRDKLDVFSVPRLIVQKKSRGSKQ